MFQALHTTMTLDDALDALKLNAVHRSWMAAQRRNDDRISDIIAARRKAAE